MNDDELDKAIEELSDIIAQLQKVMTDKDYNEVVMKLEESKRNIEEKVSEFRKELDDWEGNIDEL